MAKHYNELISDIQFNKENGVASRRVDTGHSTVWDCKIVDSDYESQDIVIHRVQRDTIKRTVERMKNDDASYFTVETINFIGRDGVRHSIKLFS